MVECDHFTIAVTVAFLEDNCGIMHNYSVRQCINHFTMRYA